MGAGRGIGIALAGALALAGCGGEGYDAGALVAPADTPDTELRPLIAAAGLTGDASGGRAVPAIDSPLAQLGMRLFFSTSLSGNFEVACASCHFPSLGGGDGLSLPVGTAALDPALVGPGRSTAAGAPNVPRNSPTTFNIALLDRVLFHDGRVESLAPQPGANGAAGAIRTPDVAFGQPDADAGATLPAAQARFPVTVDVEMRGDFLAGAGNAQLRDRLAQRIGGYGDGAEDLARNDWLPLFQAAFGVAAPASTLVTFDNIAAALAAYERSQLLTDTPWGRYVAGDAAAIPDAAKRGAIVFLRPANQGGGACATCHRGDRFTDEAFHTLAVPQIGPGKGDGPTGDDDFGRFRETGDPRDRWAFRTAPLLNVALTAPYGHAGAYATLPDMLRHYRNPAGAVAAFFAGGGWCPLPQFAALPAAQCQALYPNAVGNSNAALDKLRQDRAAGAGLPAIQLSDAQVADLAAFLETLTDPCAAQAQCLARWQPPDDGGPDDRQLRAVNGNGTPL